ncbi:hypothetical protein ABFA07_019806 [Porites harrisoni]
MARTDNKTMVYFPVGVGIMCVICLFTVAVPVKGYSGYDGARTPPPNSNNATIQTFIVNVNQTFQIVAKRMNADYELALFKDGNKVLALPKNNKTFYINPENKKDKEKNKKHFQMLFTNGSHFQIIFKSGSSAYIQGHYVVRYYMNGRMPPEDPEPLSFSIEENVTSIKPTENELQPTMASINYSSTAGNTTAGKKGAKPTEKEMQLPFSPSKGNTTAGKKDAKPTEKETPSNGLVHTRNPGRSPSSSSNTLILVLAISGSILVLFIVLCIIYLLWRLKNNKRSRIGADVRGIEGGGFELQDIV